MSTSASPDDAGPDLNSAAELYVVVAVALCLILVMFIKLMLEWKNQWDTRPNRFCPTSADGGENMRMWPPDAYPINPWGPPKTSLW